MTIAIKIVNMVTEQIIRRTNAPTMRCKFQIELNSKFVLFLVNLPSHMNMLRPANVLIELLFRLRK